MPVANGGLSLYEKEEGRGKVVHIGHAWTVGIISRPVQVTSQVGDAPPHRGHDQPGDCVGQQEDEQVPAPPEVHQRGEEVGEVAAALATQVAVLYVAAPVLVHEALPLSAGAGVSQAHRLVLVPKLPAHGRHAAGGRGPPRARWGGGGAGRGAAAPLCPPAAAAERGADPRGTGRLPDHLDACGAGVSRCHSAARSPAAAGRGGQSSGGPRTEQRRTADGTARPARGPGPVGGGGAEFAGDRGGGRAGSARREPGGRCGVRGVWRTPKAAE